MPDKPRRFSDRSLLAVGMVALISVLLITRAPAAAASSPVLSVHTGPGGVVVDSPTVTVTGTGKVMGAPDTLTIAMHVTCSAAHASDALHQNDERTSQLIAKLTSSGTDPKDITTSSLNINPTYSNDGNGTITGYNVVEDLSVTLRDLSKAGAILDSAATTVGDAVRVDSMSLSISDNSALLVAARGQAGADAKARATALAEGAGAHLGMVKSISEQSASAQPWVNYTSGSDLAKSASAVPVSPGQQQLSVSVTVVYDLNG